MTPHVRPSDRTTIASFVAATFLVILAVFLVQAPPLGLLFGVLALFLAGVFVRHATEDPARRR